MTSPMTGWWPDATLQTPVAGGAVTDTPRREQPRECYACMVGVATGPESHDTDCALARPSTFAALRTRGCACGATGHGGPVTDCPFHDGLPADLPEQGDQGSEVDEGWWFHPTAHAPSPTGRPAWAVPPGARKAHYFITSHTRAVSVCARRWRLGDAVTERRPPMAQCCTQCLDWDCP